MSETTTKRSPCWMRILLTLSLAANLCVLAAVATIAWHHGGSGHHHRGHHGGKMKGVGGPLIRALNEEERQQLRKEMKSIRRADRATRESANELDTQILAILRSDPFDPSALTELLTEKQNPFIHRMEQGRTLLISQIASMSEQERASYTDRVEAELAEYRKRRKKNE